MFKRSDQTARPNAEKLIRSLFTALGFFLIYYAVRMVISNAITIFLLLEYKSPDKAVSVFNQNANAISLFCNIAVIVVLFIVLSVQKRNITDILHLKKVRPSLIFLSFFSGIFLNLTTSGIISLLPDSILKNYSEATSTIGNGPTIWFIISAVIVAPIVEELVFRSLIISSLLPGLGHIISVLVSSLIFGAIHSGPVWIAYAFVLGSILACVFLRTGSVYSSIALHFGFNLMNLFPYLSLVIRSEKAVQTIYLTLTYLSLPLASVLIFLIFFITRDPTSNGHEDIERI